MPTYEMEELQELLKGSTIRIKFIDPAGLGRSVNAGSDETQLTTYIADKLIDYMTLQYEDEEIFVTFQGDFKEWTKEMFERAHRSASQDLKRILRLNGVYTGRINGPLIEQLIDLAHRESFPEWPEDDLKNRDFNPASHAYRRKQQLGKTINEKPTEKPTEKTHEEDVQQSTEGHQDDQRTDDRRTPFSRPSTTPFSRPHYTPDASDELYDPYRMLPPRPVKTVPLDPNIMRTFTNMWPKDMDYSGELYDILDDKVRLFFSFCENANIQPNQFNTVFLQILKGRAQRFYVDNNLRALTFADAYLTLKEHFDTEVNHATYHTDWTTTTFKSIKEKYPDLSMLEALQKLIDRKVEIQHALGPEFGHEKILKASMIEACQGIESMKMAVFSHNKNPNSGVEELFSDLRAAIQTEMRSNPAEHMATEAQYMATGADINMVDRRYHRNGGGGRGGYNRGYGEGSYNRGYGEGSNFRGNPRGRSGGFRNKWQKRCFVCRKTGCWSTKHTPEERKRARNQYLVMAPEPDNWSTFMIQYEGHEWDASHCDYDDSPPGPDCDDDDDPEVPQHVQVQFTQAVNYLADQAFMHRVTGEDSIYQETHVSETEAQQFIMDERYSRDRFQGIIADTGAAKWSTAGQEQCQALCREDPTVEVDKSQIGEAAISFGPGDVKGSEGVIKVHTAIGIIDFHILPTRTPFLLCVDDMDRMGVYLRNTKNLLIKEGTDIKIPVFRKWGHPFFHLGKGEQPRVFLAENMFLTEKELRRLHRRFGHPATDRLHRILKKAGHDDMDYRIMEEIEKFCHHCQMHSAAPRRFKFTLKDDIDFNYEVVIDVMYINGKPVLHMVDVATSFQSARWLKSLSAKDTWDAFRLGWIDVYLGPPDILTHDPGTNFASVEFHGEAKVMGVTCKEMPVEAHWSVGKAEKYHGPLRRAYEIFHAEFGNMLSPENMLQMAVKAVNDTAGPDGLVPTLLVFGAYPRMTTESPPTPSTLKRAETIQKAMKAVRKAHAQRQVNDALNTRNGPSVTEVLALPLQSEVRVWREKQGKGEWTGPFKIISIDGRSVIVDMANGPTKFRCTHVRPYHCHENAMPQPTQDNPDNHEHESALDNPAPIPEPQQPRRRGRPPGSRNRSAHAYMTKREEDDYNLAIKLRKEGRITTPGNPFESSDGKEIQELLDREVFEFVDERDYPGHHIFGSRLVREIKGKNSNPYEKSRLVLQGHSDDGKREILTQSPTIQRISQRLLLALCATFIWSLGMFVALRDITQAYPQSHTKIQRILLARLPKELRHKYPPGTLMRLVRPLYGAAESGVHWFFTYHGHHTEKLNMSVSTFDPCLLITDGNPFGIVGMQTDDTLMVGTQAFLDLEEKKIQEVGFRTKPRTTLSPEQPLEFNGCKVTMENHLLGLWQKGQGAKIIPVNPKSSDAAKQYREQRARGAYIASICQPEAAFDLSTAAQAQSPQDDDINKLNTRLQWQMDNLDRGLRYIPVDLRTAKLMVFVDGSFANNRDLSSQLGFLLTLVNEVVNGDNNGEKEKFTARGNILHWSSTKCKRVTRSTLASEVYGMMGGFDYGVTITSTLKQITERLKMQKIPLILCTDSYSLYECIVRMGTTKEKRLMIDIMALRESYERREITEIRWINGKDNPADALTKSSPNGALTRLIDTNEVTIRIEGYVQRPERPI